MKIGLFFGSFNPIHIGHLIVGQYMAEMTDLDRVWFVVSPQNPLKNNSTLAPEKDRLKMVSLALKSNKNLVASDVEFGLSKPSYTVYTMKHLENLHPEHEFVLIMGGDNIGRFEKWKNYKTLLKRYFIYVYKRPYYKIGPFKDHNKVRIFDAPLLNISSTYIRSLLHSGKSIRYLVHENVEKYMLENQIYKPDSK